MAWARRRNILDNPNHRSSHTRPTPRGGGVAIVIVFYAALLAVWTTGLVETRSLVALVCGLPVAVVGYIDDLRPLSARLRLVVQAACAVAALAVLMPLPALSVWQHVAPAWLAVLLYGVALVWLTNLYNFMDGIDTIAAGQAVAIGLLWAAFLPGAAALPALLFAAAALGFLVYNWPPARIFMGDVGSGFCGFIAGVLVLLFARDTDTSPLAWLIPLSAFVCDATVTLIVRTLRGHRPGVAHRSHAYQRLARKAGRHLPVSVGYVLATVLLTGPALAWAQHQPSYAALALLACLLPFALAVLLVGGGRDD